MHKIKSVAVQYNIRAFLQQTVSVGLIIGQSRPHRVSPISVSKTGKLYILKHIWPQRLSKGCGLMSAQGFAALGKTLGGPQSALMVPLIQSVLTYRTRGTQKSKLNASAFEVCV